MTRSRWQSLVASFASLWMKVSRWFICSTKSLNQGIAPNYVQRLLTAFPIDETDRVVSSKTQAPKSKLVEPLSQRELEVLQLIAQGLSNREISKRLFLSLNTVKGHNRIIFGKLQVQRRTEAVARARELGLL